MDEGNHTVEDCHHIDSCRSDHVPYRHRDTDVSTAGGQFVPVAVPGMELYPSHCQEGGQGPPNSEGMIPLHSQKTTAFPSDLGREILSPQGARAAAFVLPLLQET